MTVELADAGDEGGVVTLDLGQLDVDAGVGLGGTWGVEQLDQRGQTVADRVEHLGLEPTAWRSASSAWRTPPTAASPRAASDHSRFLRSNSSG